MSLEDFRKLQREHAFVQASYMKFNITRLLAFIPIFLIVFPLGSLIGVELYYFLLKFELRWFINPLLCGLILAIASIPFVFLEADKVWSRVYPEMTGSGYAPLLGPTSGIFFTGVITPLWMRPEQFESVTEGGRLIFSDIFLK